MIEALRVDERATWLIQMYSHDDDNLMTYAFNDESTPIEFECDRYIIVVLNIRADARSNEKYTI